MSPTEEGEASKVKVKVRMNIHGVFFVKSATMVEKQKVEEEESMESEPTAPSQSESQGGEESVSVNRRVKLTCLQLHVHV